MISPILSRFDVRPRLLALLFFIILFFLPFTLPVLGILLGTTVIVSLLLSGPSRTAGVIKPVLPLLVMVVLFTPLFFPRGRVLLTLGTRVVLTWPGLREVLMLLCRFSGITLVFALFGFGTKSDEFIACLRWYGLPFRAALIINLTLRSVPELLELYRRVRDAHSLRAPYAEPLGKKKKKRPGSGWIKRLLSVVPHLTSVLIITVKRIEPLSMSLELRGAGIRTGRTVLRPLPGGKKLILHFGIFVLMAGFLVFLLVKTPSVWYKSP